jgi:ribosomal protein S18 acetylase RimI-like enzyme
VTRFYPDAATVPVELRTDEVLLRMLRATDVDLDYDAVMASRDRLLIRSRGSWPRDGFTREENLSDLQGHERDHLARTSFTYTVMNLSETLCLGCVYINPLDGTLRRLGATEGQLATAGDDEAVVTFWVRPDHGGPDLDRRLFDALRSWFAREWAFARVTFMANESQHREQQLYEGAGLRRRYAVDAPEVAGAYYIYG